MTNVILDECQKTDLSAEQMDQLIRNFHTAIGWDPLHEALLPSSYLSSGTWGQILHATTLVLDEGNIPDAKEKVQFWHDNLGDIHANDKPLIDDLPGFMSILRQQYEGVLIAICTSDDRSATNSCIKNWKLQDYIDVSLRFFNLIKNMNISALLIMSHVSHLFVYLSYFEICFEFLMIMNY